MSPRKQTSRVSGRGWQGLLLLALLTCGAFCGYYFWPGSNPKTLFKLALATRDPAVKIRRLQQAVAAAKGDFPAAEMQLCLTQAQANDWDQVSTMIGTLDQSRYSADDLAKLVEVAKLSLFAREWKIAEAVLQALPNNPDQTEERLRMWCMLYGDTGRHRQLIETIERLTQIAPDEAAYWWSLAQTHEQLENTMAAIHAYESAIENDLPPAEQSQMQHRLVDHCIEAGDAAGARKHLDDLRAAGERGPRIDVYEARLCHLEGHPDQALKPLEAALRELGEIPEALRLRGILNLELGHLEQSAADLKRVIELTPNDEIAFFKLAEAYRRMGQGSSGEQYHKLSAQYHRQYLVIHNRQLRIKDVVRKLSQTPEDANLHSELKKLKSELTK